MRRHLQVIHIPFVPGERPGEAVVDALWARDLAGLVATTGPVRVAAPELPRDAALKTWGPSAETLGPDSGVTFVGFPPINSRQHLWRWPAIRSILAREVAAADLVQTSNFFPPYVGLSYAHDQAVKLGKRTLFVVAEDFYDMLLWEWVRPAEGLIQRWRRSRQLATLDRRVRKSASTASLTFLHTPAAVARYRDAARQGFAIRQPGHETEDVIDEPRFNLKLEDIQSGKPLAIVAACRHRPLKGLDFLVRAASILAERGIRFTMSLYGGGEETGSLKNLVARCGLARQVAFPGALTPGPAIYRAIADGHVFAMPHRTTDFGRAFYDAMAGGVPVVAFRTPASIDTVREGVDGLVCPLDDVESLASTLRRLHEDRQLLTALARGARSRALAETRSAWYGIRAARISELFEDEPSP